jgi:peroxiredoxin
MVMLPEADRSPAPAFSTRNLDDQPVTLEDYRGKVVLLHFWATWCGPCKEEMPHMEALWKKYRDKGLVVVGITVQEEPNGQIRAFSKEHDLSFPILLDSEGKISEMYDLSAMPSSYIVSADGKLAGRVKGPEDWNKPYVQQMIEDLLI